MLDGVPFQWKHQTHGHVALVAGDDGGIIVQQGGHYAMGEGDLPVVEHHDADILDRYGRLFLRLVVMEFQFDHQLSVAEREIGGM